MNRTTCLLRAALAVLLALGATGAPVRADDYRGKFTPDADYVLSGRLARDLPPLPKVPFRYITEGFAADRLSEVPPPGVHPRIVLSPSDIEAIRKRVANVAHECRIFRVAWRDTLNKAARPGADRPNFGQAPWAGIGPVACKALVALLTDDAKLGREAAEWTIKHARYIEPRADLLNTHPAAASFKANFYYWSRAGVRVGGLDYHEAYTTGGAERVAELAKQSVEFFGQDNQYSYASLGYEYDYACKFLTADERSYVRGVIAKCTRGKYTTGMEIPGHFFINNHMSMGAEFLCLALAIEGEDGYDPRILQQYAPRLTDKMTYDISPDGILYENVKGFIPLHPIWAAGRRGKRNHLRHSHLKAVSYAVFHNAANLHNRHVSRGRNRQGEPLPKLGQGSAEKRYWTGVGTGGFPHAGFFWNWVMKYFYPDDPVVDFVYKTNCVNQNYDLYDGSADESNYNGKIHYNMRSMADIMLLTATDGHKGDDGKPIDYDRAGLTPALRKLPMAWGDMRRGLAAARSGWGKDALMVHYECRSDFFYGGHETPEHGDFRLAAGGILWSPYTGAYMNPYFHNMVVINGMAGVYQPVAGRMIGVYDTPAAATFVSDATDGYNWRKQEKNFYLWHPMLKTTPVFTDWLRDTGFRMDRTWELPFHRHMREFYDGFAHLDWGPWHGETRGPEYYQRWNDVDHVFRTLHLARGAKPYVLIVDDVMKDGRDNQYDWCMALAGDVELYKATCRAKNRQNIKREWATDIGTDLLFTQTDAELKRVGRGIFGGTVVNVGYHPKKGDPMLLVRVLWRKTRFAYPLPSFEKTWSGGRVKIPAYADRPEFRVLLFPHRFGDKLPITTWSDDRRRLTVTVGDRTDTYEFATTDRGRTVLRMGRDGKTVAHTPARPPRPVLDTPAGYTADLNRPDAPRTHRFSDTFRLAFRPAASGSEIRYAVVPVGAKPAEPTWQVYTGPLPITRPCTVRAVTVHDNWPFAGPNKNLSARSRETVLVLRKTQPLPPAPNSAEPTARGLALDVFELRHTIFDGRGFFTGTKSMMPDLSKAKPIHSVRTDGFVVPRLAPKTGPREMKKGFFRYTGFLRASTTGLHRFHVHSPGPVTLAFDGRLAMEYTGPYGQSVKDRYGEVALAAGDHTVELVVCDPVFWKGAMERPVPLTVRVMAPGQREYLPIHASSFRTPRAELEPARPPAPLAPGRHAEPADPLTPGLVRNCYNYVPHMPPGCAIDRGHNRTEFIIPTEGLPPDYYRPLAKGAVQPYLVAPASTIDRNKNMQRLSVYRGYFKARQKGVYEFRLDPTGANELYLGGVRVAANRIRGELPGGRVALAPGLYEIELRLAKGKGTLEMKLPGAAELQPVAMGDLLRPGQVQPRRSTAASAYLPCDRLTGERTPVVGQGGIKVRVVAGKLVEGAKGKAIALPNADSRVELAGLASPEDATTVAFWLRRGKHGDSTAVVGLPYKFLVRLRSRDAIWAMYERGYADMVRTDGGKSMADKQWTHLAVSFGQEIRVYVNGKLVQLALTPLSGRYTPSTDASPTALTFLQGETAGAIDEVHVYNRILSAEEVEKLSQRSR